MLRRFLRHINQHQLLPEPNDQTLLALSGGIDSMVMATLFLEAGLPFGVGHCNFQLRGAASDADELFVKAWCEKNDISCFTTRFATAAIAEERGQSIQACARELRYRWLEEMRRENDYQGIATAHHLNDAIETFFYHFARGAGLNGLMGIPVRNGAIIRPMLFAKREEIEAYARENGIAFREDSSNAEDQYVRNRIRHHLIPLLEDINPDFIDTAGRNLGRLQEAYYWYRKAIFGQEQQIITACEGEIRLSIAALKKHQAGAGSFLYEHLKGYGFHPDQLAQALACALQENRVGAQFFSATHRLLVDRDSIIVEAKTKQGEEAVYTLEEGQTELLLPDGRLILLQHSGRPEKFPVSPGIALVDAAKVRFPLHLRHWRHGDCFQPLGMKGHKQKLQDFFSNQKLNIFAKDRVWLLTDAQDEIIWVIGHRLDERFKIDENTTAYWRVEFIPFGYDA